MRLIRRSISSERSAFSWVCHPRGISTWPSVYICGPPASMTTGGARVVWSGVRRSIASVFFADYSEA